MEVIERWYAGEDELIVCTKHKDQVLKMVPTYRHSAVPADLVQQYTEVIGGILPCEMCQSD